MKVLHHPIALDIQGQTNLAGCIQAWHSQSATHALALLLHIIEVLGLQLLRFKTREVRAKAPRAIRKDLRPIAGLLDDIQVPQFCNSVNLARIVVSFRSLPSFCIVVTASAAGTTYASGKSANSYCSLMMPVQPEHAHPLNCSHLKLMHTCSGTPVGRPSTQLISHIVELLRTLTTAVGQKRPSCLVQFSVH